MIGLIVEGEDIVGVVIIIISILVVHDETFERALEDLFHDDVGDSLALAVLLVLWVTDSDVVTGCGAVIIDSVSDLAFGAFDFFTAGGAGDFEAFF